LGLLLCAGCSLSTPSASFYTLSSTAVPANGNSKLAVGVTLTEFPEALDRPQIMLRTGENRLDIEELHRWAGPLEQQLLQVLTENLVRLTGSQRIARFPWEKGFIPDRQLSVAILRFDGAPSGSALLQVRWSLSDAEGQLLHITTATRQEPTGATIESLVAAQSRLVAGLAEEIAEALNAP
jgi:uncharacterized lipoprotein YmbA